MVKTEKLDHIHLVYHFTVPLSANEFTLQRKIMIIHVRNLTITTYPNSHPYQNTVTVNLRGNPF